MADRDCNRGRSLDERTAINVLRKNGIAVDTEGELTDATPLPVAQDETAPIAAARFTKAAALACSALDLLDLAIKRPTAENLSPDRLQVIADGLRAAADALVLPIGPKTITRQSVELATVPIVLEVGGWAGRPKASRLPCDIVMDIGRLGILAGIQLAAGTIDRETAP